MAKFFFGGVFLLFHLRRRPVVAGARGPIGGDACLLLAINSPNPPPPGIEEMSWADQCLPHGLNSIPTGSGLGAFSQLRSHCSACDLGMSHYGK